MATLDKIRINDPLSYNDLSDTPTIPDISTKADKTNVLELDNTTPFTPNADYEPATKKYVDDNAGGAPEGTAVKSTGETGGTKFLREDGDGTCSWQIPAGSHTQNTDTNLGTLTTKNPPLDADSPIQRDAAGNTLFTSTWTQIKAFLKTYFDGIYQAVLGFTPEDVANKQSDLTASSTKYPTVNAVNAGLANYLLLSGNSNEKIVTTAGITLALTDEFVVIDTFGNLTEDIEINFINIDNNIGKRILVYVLSGDNTYNAVLLSENFGFWVDNTDAGSSINITNADDGTFYMFQFSEMNNKWVQLIKTGAITGGGGLSSAEALAIGML